MIYKIEDFFCFTKPYLPMKVMQVLDYQRLPQLNYWQSIEDCQIMKSLAWWLLTGYEDTLNIIK